MSREFDVEEYRAEKDRPLFDSAAAEEGSVFLFDGNIADIIGIDDAKILFSSTLIQFSSAATIIPITSEKPPSMPMQHVLPMNSLSISVGMVPFLPFFFRIMSIMRLFLSGIQNKSKKSRREAMIAALPSIR